tara:strand:+ start:68 stop:334 length:267 start_codon:yes stop_codon:yes gene_type:complete
LQLAVTGQIPNALAVRVKRAVAHPTVVQKPVAIVLAKNKIMSSTWSSGIGKFPKKDPNHGSLWKKIKHWFCKVGLCNFDKCKCTCHKK